MTEKLRSLLHDRATDVDFATPDLDTLVRAGDRRRRRRSSALVGGVAALAVAGVLIVPALTGGDDEVSPSADDTSTTPPAPLTWVTGSVIHTGDQQVDVGVPIAAYVVNDTGYVFAGTDDSVYAVLDGEVSEIGRIDADSARLVTDHDSSFVGWVSTEGDRPTYVVHDLAAGSRVLESTSDAGTRPRFYALDGNTAYWRDQRGAVAVDVTTGDAEVVQDDAGEETGFDLLDVQAGVLALYGAQGVEIGTSVEDAEPLPGAEGSGGTLSPSATRFAPDAEELTVLGVDGGDLTPALDGYFFATVYEWADDDTVHVIALEDEASAADLLTCSIPTGKCELLADAVGRMGGLQLPVGEPLGG
ncbi:hypothetical protein NSZ01_05690 [Nocardioides szechwanensis]|uniref:DUF5050 domain-containing protein n=1 Tax=Nocardioides szechwanensis TaxID=1005944 RepID=A0A1G9VYN8_9ACTN|nr:hypothetical protein [Nocardioides szechwanensis]GEP32801.1 hypothetical protein NSZ01_05690 [Nocardioides szechwanensis]SDM77047.1 hypothetical protein SAMN05192576_0894 [Nocardioides szechwanensis]